MDSPLTLRKIHSHEEIGLNKLPLDPMSPISGEMSPIFPGNHGFILITENVGSDSIYFDEI